MAENTRMAKWSLAGTAFAFCSSLLLAAPVPDAASRGWITLHGPLHAHTPYSHDACDDEGLMEDGSPNPECLAELRQAICDSRHNFIMFTDHPSNMMNYPIEALVLYDPALGDRLLLTDTGILANEMSCSSGGDDWVAWVTTGAEDDHGMPAGLESHLSDTSSYTVGMGENDSLEAGQEAVVQTHEASAVATLAHAEEDDVTASRMLDLGIDAVELYNAHANFEWMAYHNPLQLLQLDSWMAADPSGRTDFDLVALVMMPYAPTSPLEKWDEALGSGRLAGVIGTDVHQNVVLDPYCETGSPFAGLCQRLQPLVPNLVAYLEVGGPIMMGDGERLDSYRRMFRWFSNHVLAESRDMSAVKRAMAHGRLFASFDILGMPEGFDTIVVNSASGQVYEMGDELPWSSSLTLQVRIPTVSMDDPYATWTPREADLAIGRAEIHRIDSNGGTIVLNQGDLGDTIEMPLEQPGVYRVEVYMRPRHLLNVLGDNRGLAVDEFLWVWGNPIYVR